MNNFSSIIRVVLFAVLAMGFLLVSPVSKAAASDDSVRFSKLLSKARGQALQLSEDTSEMESFAPAVSWRSHVDAVDRIKLDVNLMGRQLARLDETRDEGSPWEKNAIERIAPMLQELASNTGVVIEDLNEGPNHQNNGAYRACIEANSNVAAQLWSLLASLADYGKTKRKLDPDNQT